MNSTLIPINIPKHVYDALRRYKAKSLAPWPSAYKKVPGFAGHDANSGQEVDSEIVQLFDSQNNLLAELHLPHNGTRPQFIVKAGKEQWFAK